eukprot:2290713-Amphidinium_carterae.1
MDMVTSCQEEWTVMSERLNKGLKANNCYRALCASVCGTRMSKDDIVDEINEALRESKKTGNSPSHPYLNTCAMFSPESGKQSAQARTYMSGG